LVQISHPRVICPKANASSSFSFLARGLSVHLFFLDGFPDSVGLPARSPESESRLPSFVFIPFKIPRVFHFHPVFRRKEQGLRGQDQVLPPFFIRFHPSFFFPLFFPHEESGPKGHMVCFVPSSPHRNILHHSPSYIPEGSLPSNYLFF